MDIAQGFQIENPKVFIPWSVSQSQLLKLLSEHGLRHITTGYFTITCKSMGGNEHELGFHFEPRPGDILYELEFFRKSYADKKNHFKNSKNNLKPYLEDRIFRSQETKDLIH